MKKKKQVSEIIIILLVSLATCFFLIISAVYYKVGAVDRAIFNFGIAMIVGMYTSGGMISQKLSKQLSALERLEKLAGEFVKKDDEERKSNNNNTTL
ncbi:MAG: hypothetical protein ACYSYU_06315 [Planctomycetota bacterium]|jgi:hypothetical protein